MLFGGIALGPTGNFMMAIIATATSYYAHFVEIKKTNDYDSLA